MHWIGCSLFVSAAAKARKFSEVLQGRDGHGSFHEEESSHANCRADQGLSLPNCQLKRVTMDIPAALHA